MMPELITQPDAPQESQFEKYAPLIKSIAAIGIGALGDSGMSRGIATGLAKSAENDVNIKNLMDEARREQTLKDIKARQAQTKLKFDTMYKIWNGIDTAKGKALYADAVGMWAVAKEHLGTDVAIPSTPEVPKGITVNTKAIREQIDGIKDPAHKAKLEVFFGVMQQALSEGDGPTASLSIERIQKSLEPKTTTFYKADGSGAKNFINGEEAFNAGYPLSSFPTSKEDPTAVDKYDLKIRSKDIDALAERLQNGSYIVYDNETVNYVKGFETLGAQIKAALLLANNIPDGVPPRLNESPLPGIVEGHFELLATSKFLKKVANGSTQYPGAIEKLGTMAGIEEVVRSNIDEILQMAENETASYQDRKPLKLETASAPSVGPAQPPVASGDDELIDLYMSEEGMTREEAIEAIKGL